MKHTNIPDILEKLTLMRKSRDTLKRIYERGLRQLKYHEERNLQRERNSFDTSLLKKRVAEAKAELDRYEANIYHLEKWRNKHQKK